MRLMSSIQETAYDCTVVRTRDVKYNKLSRNDIAADLRPCADGSTVRTALTACRAAVAQLA